jgi:hypothetical protein
MAERRWALAPLQGLLLATLVLLAAVGLALWLTLRGPSLGLELKAAGERGVRVVAVSPQGPAAGVLDVGDATSGCRSPPPTNGPWRRCRWRSGCCICTARSPA